MVALWNRADHYIFALSFVLSSFFLSSPNLSRRRLDVCYTSTHGVALVRISNAGLKRAARGSLKYRTQFRLNSKVTVICQSSRPQEDWRSRAQQLLEYPTAEDEEEEEKKPHLAE